MFTHIAKICFKYPENPSRKWTVCWFIVCKPVIIDIHGHRFEIFTLVSEIHKNVDVVLGIKNVFEGVIDSCDSFFSFLDRSIPFLPKKRLKFHQSTKGGSDRGPIYRKLSGMAIMKVLDMNEHVTTCSS